MDLAHRRLTPDFHILHVSDGDMDCVSYDLCVYHFWFVFFSWAMGVIFCFRVTGACLMTADLVLRVNVRTRTLWDAFLFSWTGGLCRGGATLLRSPAVCKSAIVTDLASNIYRLVN